MELILEEMEAQTIGSRVIQKPPMWKVYVDGVYSGHIPYDNYSTLMLFRQFTPSEVERIKDGVRKLLGRGWVPANLAPQPKGRTSGEEEDEDDWL